MIVKKYLYNYQTIIHFSTPVTNHFFSLRCMPCVNACQQVVKRDMFLHPSDYLIYGADAWEIRCNTVAGPRRTMRLFLSAAEKRSLVHIVFQNSHKEMCSGWNRP